MASEAEHLDVIYNNYLPHSPKLTYLFPYKEIHNRYALSVYGIHHSEQHLRFAQLYPYDPVSMLDDLGDDVHPVRHMAYTEAAIARPFMEEQNLFGEERFSVDQIRALRMAALLHDLGECTHQSILEKTGHSVGDIAWAHKTAEDGEKEAVIRHYLYDALYPDVPSDFLDETDDIIDNNVGTLPREAFYAMERIGYFRTAMRAGELAIKLIESGSEHTDERLAALGRLSVQVSGRHRKDLQSYSERFPFVDKTLKELADIDERVQSRAVELSPETVSAK